MELSRSRRRWSLCIATEITRTMIGPAELEDLETDFPEMFTAARVVTDPAALSTPTLSEDESTTSLEVFRAITSPGRWWLTAMDRLK